MGAATNPAITAVKGAQPSAPHTCKRISFKLSASYANPGGDTLDIPTLVGAAVDDILHVAIDPSATWKYTWDRVNGKVHAHVLVTGAEVANATDLSGTTVTASVIML